MATSTRTQKNFLGFKLNINNLTALQKAMTLAYTRELTASQLELLISLLPTAKPTGCPRKVNLTWVLYVTEVSLNFF